MKIYPTISEALCQGGQRLDVDGVLLNRRARKVPRPNPKGQRLYPRYEFFQQIVDALPKKGGRSVPVFNDKHLSGKTGTGAKEMVETARELDFPLLAGPKACRSRDACPRSTCRGGGEGRGGHLCGGRRRRRIRHPRPGSDAVDGRAPSRRRARGFGVD
ncbi:MAG: hypothetical protein CM1200mP2_28730 [Planctomycetaceae bacterium]|nr:MAG: hypothetical protein CM1200mP2_28730 [Planctomycetaceae bacterium]